MSEPPEGEDPFGGDAFVLRLPPSLDRLGEVRRFVCEAIGRWGAEPPEDAGLLTSEVVSNAMIHANGEVAVRVRRDGDQALVEVHDQSSQVPQPRPSDPGRAGGMGMQLVEVLASGWGVTEIKDDGKVVWFEVPLT